MATSSASSIIPCDSKKQATLEASQVPRIQGTLQYPSFISNQKQKRENGKIGKEGKELINPKIIY